MAQVPSRSGENHWRRWLCDTFAGRRFSVADLHRAYAATYKRPLPLQPARPT